MSVNVLSFSCFIVIFTKQLKSVVVFFPFWLSLLRAFFLGNLNMKELIEQLKLHEGFRSNFYLCTADKKTIGYGRNVDSNPFTKEEVTYFNRILFDRKPMTEDEADYLLRNDVNKIIEQIKPLLPWHELSEPRKAVCVNMAFNLGVSGFSKFKNMIFAINDYSYKKASIEMLDSRWAKQVPNRANELANQMKSGVWK